MLSHTQMCKIWEKHSFINISKFSLRSPRFKKKCNFNKIFKISVKLQNTNTLKRCLKRPLKARVYLVEQISEYKIY